MDAWSKTIEELIIKLETSVDTGLSEKEALSRLQEFGPNSITVKKKTSPWIILLRQFTNPIIYILIIAAGIAFFLGEFLDGWSIIAIVVLNSIIGFVQEMKAESSIDALESITSPRARVLRDGKQLTIDSVLICPGDILLLEAGDYVPADARFISTRQIQCDESILTGESLPVEKSSNVLKNETILAERINMTYAGTAVVNGSGSAVVVGTGKETEIGQIAKLMDDTVSEATPLQQKLEKVSRVLLLLGLVVIILVALIGLYHQWSLTEIVMTALAISIAAIPEGLPTVVTIALVMAIRRMSKKKALVRKMHSVETLGATDVICTDKTGTLTTGKMSVRETHPVVEQEIYQSIMILCNTASIEGEATGDTTEIALLQYAQNQNLNISAMNQAQPRQWEWSFDSNRKRMSVAVNNKGKTFIYSKGAPEAVLAVCYVNDKINTDALSKANEFSEKGMRVLAFAFREIQDTDFSKMGHSEAEKDLTFAGLIAITDPPREESIAAVKKCQESGIRVIMITGDHPRTAAAIAFELGIINSAQERVLTGIEMDKLSGMDLLTATQEVSVYARVSPENKLQLIESLKSQDLVVSMTGDGVNDALALKAASIGVAMGKGGTEVARQASSMILTDDNFATIVDAVEEGRAVNGNIKRTLQYLLSTNLAELLFILGSTIVGWPIPILPINLLWINLVTDGLPSLALAAERVPPHYLEESVKPSAKSFFDSSFYSEMIISGVIITMLGLIVYRYGLINFELLTARSYAFTFFVYAALFRSFANRSEIKTALEMRPNIYHLIACAIPFFFQIGMQYSPLLLDVFKMRAMSFRENLSLIGISLIPLIILEIYKVIVRIKKKNKKETYVVCQ